ncbi:MAG: metallopeptidase family protein [Actinomycetes bacterium]
MGSGTFEELVGEELDALPEHIAAAMTNVVVLVEDVPPPDQPEDLLGLYDGVALTERGAWYAGVLPDRIVIFRIPTLRICANRQEVGAQVHITLVHEIGHHVGMDEQRLTELGWS